MTKENINYNSPYATMFGPKISQARAKIVLPMLVEKAHETETITYGELASEFDLRWAMPITHAVGCISGTLYKLERNQLPQAQFHWRHGKIPRITNIVVQSSGDPGAWICEQLGGVPTRAEYNKILAPIYNYDKWGEVLKALGLDR